MNFITERTQQVIGIVLVLFIAGLTWNWLFPKYSSYQECMAEYEADKRFAQRACPDCNNDWRELREYNEKRCSVYRQDWER